MSKKPGPTVDLDDPEDVGNAKPLQVPAEQIRALRADTPTLDPQQLAAIMNDATGHPSSGPLHEWIPILAERIATTYR